jgi:hypothetical protein
LPGIARAASWIAEAMEGIVAPDDGPRIEVLQLQRVEIEEPEALGVRIEVDLKSPVEEKPVDGIGADTAADAAGCLEDRGRDPVPAQFGGGRQAGDARTNDECGGTHA